MHDPILSDRPALATIRVQFMGRPSDVFGPEQALALDADGAPISAIRRRLADSLEDGAGAVLLDPTVRGGIDDAIVPDATWARPGQTVFFFSTVSGG